MPHMEDPCFRRSVTYICEHNSFGAMGIIINLPTSSTFNSTFKPLSISSTSTLDPPVLVGGPVQVNRGFILHQPKGNWKASLETGNGIYLTSSVDVIEAIANGTGPDEFLITLGYAGWDAGQLEEEIAQNAWLTAPADEELLFHMPYEDRWHATAKAIGVDLNLLATEAGHA